MFGGLGSRSSAVTFDVGAAGLRATQCRWHRGLPRVADTLQFDHGPDRVQTGPADGGPPTPAVEPAQLGRLVGQAGFAGRAVALVLSPPEVGFYPLRLPEPALAQPPARLEQALKWEVARESRESADTLEVRHWRLPRAHAQHANVMAVALPSELALRWCGLFEKEGLVLRRIDVSPCALVRLGRELWAPTDSDLWGVLDLGLRHSTLTLVIGTVPTYIRTLSVAAHQWTRQLANAFEVPLPVAEQLKRQHGVDASTHRLEAGATVEHAGHLPGVCTGVLRESLQTLAHEVGRCFSYLMQSFPEHAVKGLLLAGGGARLTGLPEVIEGELGIPVRRLTTAPEGSRDPVPGDPAGTGPGRYGSESEPGQSWPGSTVDETPTLAVGGPDAHPAPPPAPTRPPRMSFEPHTAASLGGAILDLEAS